jgi:D-alanine-D-alanine ligase
MADRTRLGVVFGGRSVEHEVSVVSAQHVLRAADRERFEIVPIGVTKAGGWLSLEETQAALDKPEQPFHKRLEGQARGVEAAVEAFSQVDVVFPLVHGTHGEDGTLQGLLELMGVPYVGCGVAASAVGMDKAVMKTLLAGAGLPVAEYLVLRTDEAGDSVSSAREVEERLGYPCFVKPANGGSSVGVSKATDREGLTNALVEAARLDRKIVVEKALEGREVECAILGNAGALTSPVGEIRHRREFYDFEAKYLDSETQVIAPAELPQDVVEQVQALSLQAFRAMDCSGLSRVDFFLLPDGSLRVVEVNTIPGFTPTSMFPLLWQAAGISYTELITRLVDLAETRHREKPVG